MTPKKHLNLLVQSLALWLAFWIAGLLSAVFHRRPWRGLHGTFGVDFIGCLAHFAAQPY